MSENTAEASTEQWLPSGLLATLDRQIDTVQKSLVSMYERGDEEGVDEDTYADIIIASKDPDAIQGYIEQLPEEEEYTVLIRCALALARFESHQEAGIAVIDRALSEPEDMADEWHLDKGGLTDYSRLTYLVRNAPYYGVDPGVWINAHATSPDHTTYLEFAYLQELTQGVHAGNPAIQDLMDKRIAVALESDAPVNRFVIDKARTLMGLTDDAELKSSIVQGYLNSILAMASNNISINAPRELQYIFQLGADALKDPRLALLLDDGMLESISKVMLESSQEYMDYLELLILPHKLEWDLRLADNKAQGRARAMELVEEYNARVADTSTLLVWPGQETLSDDVINEAVGVLDETTGIELIEESAKADDHIRAQLIFDKDEILCKLAAECAEQGDHELASAYVKSIDTPSIREQAYTKSLLRARNDTALFELMPNSDDIMLAPKLEILSGAAIAARRAGIDECLEQVDVLFTALHEESSSETDEPWDVELIILALNTIVRRIDTVDPSSSLAIRQQYLQAIRDNSLTYRQHWMRVESRLSKEVISMGGYSEIQNRLRHLTEDSSVVDMAQFIKLRQLRACIAEAAA